MLSVQKQGLDVLLQGCW